MVAARHTSSKGLMSGHHFLFLRSLYPFYLFCLLSKIRQGPRCLPPFLITRIKIIIEWQRCGEDLVITKLFLVSSFAAGHSLTRRWPQEPPPRWYTGVSRQKVNQRGGIPQIIRIDFSRSAQIENFKREDVIKSLYFIFFKNKYSEIRNI